MKCALQAIPIPHPRSMSARGSNDPHRQCQCRLMAHLCRFAAVQQPRQLSKVTRPSATIVLLRSSLRAQRASCCVFVFCVSAKFVSEASSCIIPSRLYRRREQDPCHRILAWRRLPEAVTLLDRITEDIARLQTRRESYPAPICWETTVFCGRVDRRTRGAQPATAVSPG
jgi:hypothetical protein